MFRLLRSKLKEYDLPQCGMPSYFTNKISGWAVLSMSRNTSLSNNNFEIFARVFEVMEFM